LFALFSDEKFSFSRGFSCLHIPLFNPGTLVSTGRFSPDLSPFIFSFQIEAIAPLSFISPIASFTDVFICAKIPPNIQMF